MARRLSAIAKWINENLSSELYARILKGYCNTDRKIPGTRLRYPGKGRTGTRLQVFLRDPESGSVLLSSCILDHNSAETYRYNGEVESWLERYQEDRAEGWPPGEAGKLYKSTKLPLRPDGKKG